MDLCLRLPNNDAEQVGIIVCPCIFDGVAMPNFATCRPPPKGRNQSELDFNITAIGCIGRDRGDSARARQSYWRWMPRIDATRLGAQSAESDWTGEREGGPSAHRGDDLALEVYPLAEAAAWDFQDSHCRSACIPHSRGKAESTGPRV
jgi:hypothetical protein